MITQRTFPVIPRPGTPGRDCELDHARAIRADEVAYYVMCDCRACHAAKEFETRLHEITCKRAWFEPKCSHHDLADCHCDCR